MNQGQVWNTGNIYYKIRKVGVSFGEFFMEEETTVTWKVGNKYWEKRKGFLGEHLHKQSSGKSKEKCLSTGENKEKNLWNNTSLPNL